MGLEFILATLIGVAGILGAYVGGRRNSSLAMDTINILSARLDFVQDEAKKIPDLLERIKLLEELVTQRADVEGVKVIVVRLEGKVDNLTELVSR